MTTLPTVEDQQQLNQILPELQAIVESPGWQTFSKTDYTDPIKGIMHLRGVLEMLGQAPPNPHVTDWEGTYPTRDGTSLRLLTFKPNTATTTTTTEPSPLLPVFFWFHGGGGCTGSPDSSAALCRTIAQRQNCLVVAPQYRLAPEHKFPTCMHDAWDAIQYIATHADELGGDPTQGFVVGGESFGSGISAVTTILARDEGLSPPFTGALLLSGSYLSPLAIPDMYKAHYISRTDPVCMSAPGLDHKALEAFLVALQPDYTSPLSRAALATRGHAGLPRTYFNNSGMDMVRDDTFVYRDMLHEAGVETRIDTYAGAPHCFWWMFPGAEVTARFREDLQSAMAWLFRKD